MVNIDISGFCNATSYWDIEIIACKIASNKTEQIVLDLKHQGFDIVENGIEQAVKNIADEIELPYSNIKFTSTDKLTKSQFFKHEFKSNLMYELYRTEFNHRKIIVPNKFNYGLFLGRATSERLYAFWKHYTSVNRQKGLASMHLDIQSVTEWKSDFVEFLCSHNEKWLEISSLMPYSDIGPYIKPPMSIEAADKSWEHTYKNIAIEIVCETNITPDTFFITEKTWRPIQYGKLFLVIGSPEFEMNLKRMGFDIFDDIIDKSYDTASGYNRIDAVFKALEKLLENPVNIKDLLPRLQANKQLAIAL